MTLFNEVRRAKAMLGTIVEIRARGRTSEKVEAAVEAAFAEVDMVSRLMSFHDKESDVSRLNSGAYFGSVSVHPWTFEVLRFANELSETSSGLFDVSIGQTLVNWEYLPGVFSDAPAAASFRDIELLAPSSVRFRRALRIDLGGIAKGFAVDRAMQCITACGIESAVVNAGGDLRVSGDEEERVHIRLPDEPSSYVLLAELKNEALATSSPSLLLRQNEGKTVSPLLDGKRREAIVGLVSVSVRSATCMVADALTKIVLTEDDCVPQILKSFCAKAYKISDGKIFVLE